MRVNLPAVQNMFRPQMRNSMQRTMGQVQPSGLEKVVQQVNASYGSKRDTVELSQKAQELLKNAGEAKKTEGSRKRLPAIRSMQPECSAKKNGPKTRFWHRGMESRPFLI